MITRYQDFSNAIDELDHQFKVTSESIPATQWQSTDISGWGKRGHMRELLDVSFQVHARNMSLKYFQDDIEPNLPWADTAFEERVSGIPWNPGTAWESWPWARSAAGHKQERFSHSYAERYWPKRAGSFTDDQWRRKASVYGEKSSYQGIRFRAGDLDDVVNLLRKDPLTRQAFLPMWFPEDTGVVHGERVPCTLGYHFIMRDGQFHCTYYIRSCDFIRHFRDDLYMTLRLQLWILEYLKNLPGWDDVVPGNFTFHCVSLHMFQNDWNQRYGSKATKAS